MNQKLLTVAELASFLNVPVSWVYSRTRIKGPDSIPLRRCGKYCRFQLEEVLIWLEKQDNQNNQD
jgi:hypothetical protein